LLIAVFCCIVGSIIVSSGACVAENKPFNSIWTQDTPYWLVVEGSSAQHIAGLSPLYRRANLAGTQTAAPWHDMWESVAGKLAALPGGAAGYRAAVMAADAMPSLEEMQVALKPLGEVQAIASNLWLIDHVNHGRLDCYMQRVMDRRDKQVGYEAFARMEGADGGVIGGGAIMQAAHALKVEYQLDRILHKQAIDCFVGSDLEGYIFINFLTGFIHRPEVYLDGLSQAVTRNHMRASSVILDVPLSDYAKDMAKLKSIASYCHARGFGLALDDVATAQGLASLLTEIRPVFVKIDGKFGAGMNPARAQGILHEIVRVCHETGVSVIAEGVENKEQHAQYLAAEVDLFQGYLFGAPERFPRIGQGVAERA
jgi:EAL domain-containing protein (putative c-di-GMP-specific phosphodiesterase class I)